jgi:phosphatidylserine decarboxylase
VSPIALRRSLDYLVANKRLVSVVDGATSGLVAMVEIGATFVGSIMHTARPGPVAKGEEKGLFRFGGSCVITVFEPGRIELAPDLLAQTKLGRELYARMGDDMGTVADHPHAR